MEANSDNPEMKMDTSPDTDEEIAILASICSVMEVYETEKMENPAVVPDMVPSSSNGSDTEDNLAAASVDKPMIPEEVQATPKVLKEALVSDMIPSSSKGSDMLPKVPKPGVSTPEEDQPTTSTKAMLLKEDLVPDIIPSSSKGSDMIPTIPNAGVTTPEEVQPTPSIGAMRHKENLVLDMIPSSSKGSDMLPKLPKAGVIIPEEVQPASSTKPIVLKEDLVPDMIPSTSDIEDNNLSGASRIQLLAPEAGVSDPEEVQELPSMNAMLLNDCTPKITIDTVADPEEIQKGIESESCDEEECELLGQDLNIMKTDYEKLTKFFKQIETLVTFQGVLWGEAKTSAATVAQLMARPEEQAQGSPCADANEFMQNKERKLEETLKKLKDDRSYVQAQQEKLAVIEKCLEKKMKFLEYKKNNSTGETGNYDEEFAKFKLRFP